MLKTVQQLNRAMKTLPSKKSTRAFTVTELVLTLFAVGLVIAVILPAVLPHHRPRPGHRHRIDCVNKLKQVGLAMRIYANDHEDKFPWQVSASQGGSMEFIGTGEVFRHFLAASNEIVTPKVLWCVADNQRSTALSWTNFSNTNLSYFASVDSDENRARMFLAGDRSISTNGLLRPGVLTLATNRPVRWAKGLHNDGGNVVSADGSVEKLSDQALQRAVRDAVLSDPAGPGRLEIP